MTRDRHYRRSNGRQVRRVGEIVHSLCDLRLPAGNDAPRGRAREAAIIRSGRDRAQLLAMLSNDERLLMGVGRGMDQ
jgi:hypothetical protein